MGLLGVIMLLAIICFGVGEDIFDILSLLFWGVISLAFWGLVIMALFNLATL